MSNPIKMFATRSKQLRTQNKLSQEKFCEAFNLKFDAKINISTLSRYENMDQEPMLSTVRKFADFYGVTADYLLGIEEQKENVSELEIFGEKVALILKEDRAELRELILDLTKLNDDQIKAIRAVVNSYFSV